MIASPPLGFWPPAGQRVGRPESRCHSPAAPSLDLKVRHGAFPPDDGRTNCHAMAQIPKNVAGALRAAGWRSHLLLVPHGAFPSHHDLATCLGLQLLRRQATWPQDPPHEIELWGNKEGERGVRGCRGMQTTPFINAALWPDTVSQTRLPAASDCHFINLFMSRTKSHVRCYLETACIHTQIQVCNFIFVGTLHSFV